MAASTRKTSLSLSSSSSSESSPTPPITTTNLVKTRTTTTTNLDSIYPTSAQPNNQTQLLTNIEYNNMQQQQQELIKLLAQHFHNQFYQSIALNSANSSNTNNSLVGQSTSTSSNLGTSVVGAINNNNNNTQQYSVPFEPNQASFDINLLSQNGFNANSESNHLLHNRLLSRSPKPAPLQGSSQPSSSSVTPNNRGSTTLYHPHQQASNGVNDSNQLDSFTLAALNQQQQQLSGASPYATNHLNLINALSLNLSSLQQQQQQHQQRTALIQAAAMASKYNEYSLMNPNDYQEQVFQRIQRNAKNNNNNTNNSGNGNRRSCEDNSNKKSAVVGGGERLKFSINTILGRGCSPSLQQSHDIQEQTNNNNNRAAQLLANSNPTAAVNVAINRQSSSNSNHNHHHHHHQQQQHHNHNHNHHHGEKLDNLKPAHSYIGLIGMCILSSPEKRMVLNDIYQFILDNYPYYRNRGSGWRNSVRHNLSLNECFQKAGRAANGKGHYWTIHPANMEDFMLGDFRRRRAQRKVRRFNRMDVPSDESDDESTEDANKPPLPEHFKRSLEMHKRLEENYKKSAAHFVAVAAAAAAAASNNQQQQQHIAPLLLVPPPPPPPPTCSQQTTLGSLVSHLAAAAASSPSGSSSTSP